MSSEKILDLGNGYYVQENRAYFVKGYIDGNDGNSFKILDEYLAKDKYNVYFFGEKVKGVNIETFKYLLSGYYIDNMNVYFNNSIIKDADKESFIYLGENKAKDKNFYYNKGDILK